MHLAMADRKEHDMIQEPGFGQHWHNMAQTKESRTRRRPPGSASARVLAHPGMKCIDSDVPGPTALARTDGQFVTLLITQVFEGTCLKVWPNVCSTRPMWTQLKRVVT